jgi:hypothetical protein
MLDLLNKSETETAIAATKRERIETELRNDAGRSDREIARMVGCDHKTVGAHRERMGIATPLAADISPPISPTATNPAQSTSPLLATAAKPEPEEPEENHFLPESESLVLPSQPAIAVYTNRYNQVVIRQEATGPDQDEDYFVFVCPQHLDALIVRLRKYLP